MSTEELHPQCFHCKQAITSLIQRLDGSWDSPRFFCQVCWEATTTHQSGPNNSIYFGRPRTTAGRYTGDIEIYPYNNYWVAFRVRLDGCCYRLPRTWFVTTKADFQDND